MSRARRLVLATGAVAFVCTAECAEGRSGNPPTIYPGAIEVGIAGSMTTVEGIANGSFVLRGGTFREGIGGVLGGELALGYHHISSSDVFDIEAVLSWQRRFHEGGNYPYVSIGGGLRHEEIGSFGQTRYPLGAGVGLRSLLGQRAAIRVDYAFRRILNDPVSDFSEHRITLGLSVFFRNKHPGKE